MGGEDTAAGGEVEDAALKASVAELEPAEVLVRACENRRDLFFVLVASARARPRWHSSGVYRACVHGVEARNPSPQANHVAYDPPIRAEYEQRDKKERKKERKKTKNTNTNTKPKHKHN